LSRRRRWPKKPLSRCAQNDIRQTELIQQAWSDSGKVYGYRKRYHDDGHDQPRTHLTEFMAAHTFARRLKTLGGLTPYE